jgi:hypothetical protein
MSTGPKSDYDEVPHDHTVISARSDYAIRYVPSSSASDNQLNNPTTNGNSEASNAPLNTENCQCQEPKDDLPSDTQNVIRKIDKLTKLNTETSKNGNEGRPKDPRSKRLENHKRQIQQSASPRVSSSKSPTKQKLELPRLLRIIS